MGCFELIVKKLKYDVHKKMKNWSSSEAYCKHVIEQESVSSRVPMDFTGSEGRIVVDPDEIKEIVRSEGQRRRLNLARLDKLLRQPVPDEDSYRSKPYYHGVVHRLKAASMVEKASQDGSYLLRNSESSPGCLVLTYRFRGRAHHCYIYAMTITVGHGKDTLGVTLDGTTLFKEVQALLDFYEFNQGSLYSRLLYPITTAKKKKGECLSPTKDSKSPT